MTYNVLVFSSSSLLPCVILEKKNVIFLDQNKLKLGIVLLEFERTHLQSYRGEHTKKKEKKKEQKPGQE